MTSRERIIAASERCEPDRLPTFEWSISRQIIDAFAPGGGEVDFVEAVDATKSAAPPRINRSRCSTQTPS
jgi:hypothetical protein